MIYLVVWYEDGTYKHRPVGYDWVEARAVVEHYCFIRKEPAILVEEPQLQHMRGTYFSSSGLDRYERRRA